MPFSDLQVKISSRETATSYYDMSFTVNNLQTECNEETGLNTQVIEAGVGPTLLSQGSIAKGLFFFLYVEDDDINGREPLEIRINGSDNDAITGTLIAYEADTTSGITTVHVTNPGSNSVKFRYWIAGDAV